MLYILRYIICILDRTAPAWVFKVSVEGIVVMVTEISKVAGVR